MYAFGGKEESIYFEHQAQDDNLCGLHCLNSLLQAPIYDEISLSQVAINLEKQERALLGTTNMSGDYHNVGLDGNFNIQVISAAIQQTCGAAIDSVQSERNKNKDMTAHQAFICHNHHHWIGILKKHGIWFNLNSKNSDGPQIISDFYLSAFIDGMADNGYLVFTVSGNLPNHDSALFEGNLRAHQRYYTLSQIRATEQVRKAEGTNQLNVAGYDQRDLQKVLDRNQREMNGEPLDNNESDNQPKAPQYFQGKSTSLGSGPNSVQYDPTGGATDPDLLKAMQMSMQDLYNQIPAAGPGMATLRFRMPNGSNQMWRFTQEANIQDLYNFVFAKMDQPGKFKLTKTYPRQDLEQLHQTLQQAGVGDMESLIVTKF